MTYSPDPFGTKQTNAGTVPGAAAPRGAGSERRFSPTRLAPDELREMLRERRLLRDVLAVARRDDGRSLGPLLEAVLSGSGVLHPVLLARQRPAS